MSEGEGEREGERRREREIERVAFSIIRYNYAMSELFNELNIQFISVTGFLLRGSEPDPGQPQPDPLPCFRDPIIHTMINHFLKFDEN